MAQRKRPVGKTNPRVTIEVYPDDIETWHRVKVAAAEGRVTVRELVTAVMRDWLEREAKR